MKRFHVHIAVENLAQSTQFYAALFGAQPTVLKADYAKWMLDDPRINFAISQRSTEYGLNHLGFQVESDAELQDLHQQLGAAAQEITPEVGANCCYAKADKYWVKDPSGIPWESFHTLESIPFFGAQDQPVANAPCCTPAAAAEKTTCCGSSAPTKEKCCG